MRFSSPWSRIKNKEIIVHRFIYLHDTSFVSTSITIVWCREYRHNLLLVTPIIAGHHQLMSSCYCFKAILLNELVRNVLSKCIPSSSRRYTPSSSVVRIRPKQITHWSFVRYFLDTINFSYLIKRVKTWRKASM